MVEYEELKDKLLEISEIIKKFPDSLQENVYELLVSQLFGDTTEKMQMHNDVSAEKQESTTSLTKKPPSKKARSKESYSIDPHLNLQGDKSISSFKDFVDEKKPKNFKEFNAVAVYYLEKMIGEKEITMDKIYTCYKEVNRKPPQAFRQSFIDTKNKQGWLEIDKEGLLLIPHRGVVYVENDLPATEK